MTENEVAKQIVDAAYRVHTSLGPGLLESVYEVVLAYELEKRGLHTVRQQAVPSLSGDPDRDGIPRRPDHRGPGNGGDQIGRCRGTRSQETALDSFALGR